MDVKVNRNVDYPIDRTMSLDYNVVNIINERKMKL